MDTTGFSIRVELGADPALDSAAVIRRFVRLVDARVTAAYTNASITVVSVAGVVAGAGAVTVKAPGADRDREERVTRDVLDIIEDVLQSSDFTPKPH